MGGSINLPDKEKTDEDEENPDDNTSDDKTSETSDSKDTDEMSPKRLAKLLKLNPASLKPKRKRIPRMTQSQVRVQ